MKSSMKFLAKVLVSALFGAVVMGASASAQTISVDYDHTVNFLKFKTYTWDKIHATDPTVEVRIATALDRDMAGRYMTAVGSKGDVTITAVDATQDKQEFTDFYNSLTDTTWQRPWGTGFMDTQATLADVPLNTLVIDIYDTKSHKLLWRGTVTEPEAKSEDKNERTIDKAVTELIGKYPPKYKK